VEVGNEVEGVMAMFPAVGSEEADGGGQVEGDAGPDVAAASASGGHFGGVGFAEASKRGIQERGADATPLMGGVDED
jgi:hypothetical protein